MFSSIGINETSCNLWFRDLFNQIVTVIYPLDCRILLKNQLCLLTKPNMFKSNTFFLKRNFEVPSGEKP